MKVFLGMLPYALLFLGVLFRLISDSSGDLDYQTLSELLGVAGLIALFVKLIEEGTRPYT